MAGRMARPPLELGTHGAIRCYKTATGYRARTLARGYDGQVRGIERRAKSKAAAERSLKLALRDRSRIQSHGDITADTRVSVGRGLVRRLKDLPHHHAGLPRPPRPADPAGTRTTPRTRADHWRPRPAPAADRRQARHVDGHDVPIRLLRTVHAGRPPRGARAQSGPSTRTGQREGQEGAAGNDRARAAAAARRPQLRRAGHRPRPNRSRQLHGVHRATHWRGNRPGLGPSTSSSAPSTCAPPRSG